MNIFASLDPSVKKLLGWKLGDEEEKWALKAVESLVKKLRKRKTTFGVNCGNGSVEDLEYALAHPGSHSKCVTIRRSLDGRLQVSHRKGLPHVIYCRVWRWPNIQSHHELKPTPDCHYPYDSRSEYICINPYHYQRIEQALSINSNNSTLQQQKQQQPHIQQHNLPAGVNAYSPNSPPVINGSHSLLGFPSSSTVTSTTTATTTIASFHEQQLRNQQQQMLGHTSLAFSSNLAAAQPQNFISQNQLQHLVLQHNSLSNNIFFNATGPPSVSGSSNAQSPSALSDDDDFSAAAAAAAAAFTGIQSSPTSFQFNNFAGLGANTGKLFCYDYTNNNPNSGGIDPFPDYWCSICYYELNSRVGEPFKILSNEVTVDGFTDPSDDERRICLGLLSNVNRNNTIECTRRHIGRGVRFACSDLNIAIVNISESPVFVQSRNSNFKYNLQMLERARAEGYNHVYDLQKMCFIRMSFVKGWGVDYHRQDVTSTPCWIEIQLHRPLAWIDAVLAPMTPPDHLNITSVS